MRKPEFVTGPIYHLYNRGVEKRRIFLDDDDYFRFLHDLYEFNDEESAENIYYRQAALKSYEVEPRKISKRKVLVDIAAFCLMPNHFHLLLRQHHERGIVKFMQKLGTGYTMYFNQKYERVGGLFQGRFKATIIEREAHLQYLPHYIHLNPLDLSTLSWRDGRIENMKAALRHLTAYRWSSYLDYIGKSNFPSILSRNLSQEFFGSPQEYRRSLEEWISAMAIDELSSVAIEDISPGEDILRG